MAGNDITYSADIAAVEQVGTDVFRRGHQIDNDVNDMERTVDALTDRWIGSDKDQYLVYKKTWAGLLGEMTTTLTTKAVPALNQMLDNITGTEKKIQYTWDR